MQHTSELFNEVIQMATPYCIRERDMTLVRKIKNLQEYTEKLEGLLGESLDVIKQQVQS
jgi:hypothetical protein